MHFALPLPSSCLQSSGSDHGPRFVITPPESLAEATRHMEVTLGALTRQLKGNQAAVTATIDKAMDR